MKILVIDDDIAMTELLRVILEPTAEVITCNDGAAGLEAAQIENPDIIILDLMMPNVDGWKVCKSVREYSTVPILILSALDNPGIVAEALNSGADDFLIKPVPSSILVAHINNLYRRTHIFERSEHSLNSSSY